MNLHKELCLTATILYHHFKSMPIEAFLKMLFTSFGMLRNSFNQLIQLRNIFEKFVRNSQLPVKMCQSNKIEPIKFSPTGETAFN